ncbi:hypothetical protein LCGC14_2714870, partial [marine sediment metagenome]
TLNTLDRWFKTVDSRPANINDLKALTVPRAENLYSDLYWSDPHLPCQAIAEWWEPMGHEVFDTAVNSGPERSAIFLQRTLNLLNRNEKVFDDLKVDAWAGDTTLEAMRAMDSLPRGRERLMLGSNNYLGLTGDGRVKEAARKALEHYGTALTGSRLMNGTVPLHRELEEEIATWMETEDALVFTTGYQANLGCLSGILAASDTVIVDSSDHASIFDGCKLSGARLRPFRHKRADKLQKMLERSADDGGGVLVVVDGVYSMEGDVCDVAAVADLCGIHGARLMVDEAHAVGVLGARGAGTCELYGVEDRVDLRMGTFSKSLASCGGFIAGPEDVIDYLRISSRAFLFTAAAVPAAVAAALEAVRICRSEEGPELFARVLDNAAYLHRGLEDLGYRAVEPTRLPDGSELITPIVPVVVGDDWQAASLWKALWE